MLEQFFEHVSANIRRVERERLAAEPGHLEALLAFAGRAYRRPLTPAERSGLLGVLQGARAGTGWSTRTPSATPSPGC